MLLRIIEKCTALQNEDPCKMWTSIMIIQNSARDQNCLKSTDAVAANPTP